MDMVETTEENDLDLFGEGFSGSRSSPLEESSPSENRDQVCSICSMKFTNPRVLSCLHVFCELCIDKLLIDESGDSGKRDSIVTCPKCKQETKIAGSKGASSLPCDYVLTNILDMSAIESTAVLCTSCKAKEKAVARCSDCAHFLCPNCNTAHQFMRCFENHQVVPFEDLRSSREVVPIHKPIFCDTHPAESLKFYCFKCQMPICNNCMVSDHKAPEHHYECLADAEEQQKDELKSLMAESKSKIEFCESASNHLESALGELQIQHDNAKDLIHETFHSYKAVLEKCRDKALEDLTKIHKSKELKIMDTYNSIEKTMEKINDACKFTSRLLEHGNIVEILSLKKLVGAQLLYLINNTPKPDVTTTIEFNTDINKFEDAIKATFGTFTTEVVSTSKELSPPATLPAPVPLTLNNVMAAAGMGLVTGCPTTVTTTSSPVSIHSSFDGELATNFTMATNVLNQDVAPVVPPSTLHGFTSIQEYNLQQLASLAEKEVAVGASAVNVTSTHPPASSNPSPTPSFTLADLFSGDFSSTNNAINNLQALAKLGSVTLNNQGQIVVTGDPAVSLVDPLTTATAAAAAATHSSTPTPPPATLGALLNDLTNGSLNTGPPVSSSLVLGRGASPSLEINTTIASVNGGPYQSLSGSPSPILSQPDEIVNDPIHNMPLLVGTGTAPPPPPPPNNFHHPRATPGKLPAMHIRLKYGQLGPGKGQFNSPHGFCLGTEEDIIVADTNNHRIQVFEKTGTFKFQFGIPGREEGQLWYPRKVAVMRNSGKFVVCDRGNERSRMQIFTKSGHFVKKIAIRYIDIVAGLAVTSQSHIVAVDSVSPTVFVISEGGELIHWFDCSEYMREPSDIAISGKEYFVCDFKGHCVVVFNEEGQFLRRIGYENITNFPNGIDISDAGDVLVGDSHGNRFHVAVFSRDGVLLSEFECPHVKVSRCCGLKITSEGYVVTLAKNNHHVLVLNTLYIM
ncbi:LOW QUALITY PROTEIN: B-box type zinc finger protein ncl-1-like [Schistocerca piceifrons]|uniref:LOW QUALITY PROTEIN: B-box type zinc finger protein ncl-1-like n=1 Tax=Schistocerca piceifrons TaxID=274613 RepID=UPI001F5FB725|nr:LOW QUALITY PROTEIN: B-box type zinc finger protein ncl-1-like [Schistocerca piceifrons]